MKKILLILIVFANILFAQKETNNWYFGMYAGITFNKSVICPNPPCRLKDGKINTQEGCSSISDKLGNLLFYTDGVTVWNKNHKVMKNGTGLFGHFSSTQSALIVPLPANDSIYYIFTTDGYLCDEKYYGIHGLNYSIVDLKADSGFGSIVSKNIHLLDECTEKLAATMHANCQSIWVVTHAWNSKDFLSYLLTDTGLVNKPVISSTGYFLKDETNDQYCKQSNKLASLKFSISGKLIASAIYGSGGFEIFTFDNKSGIIGNILFSDSNIEKCGSIEFSKNENFIYVSGLEQLYQYNLNVNSLKEFVYSKFSYNQMLPGEFSLQLANNNKIYFNAIDYLGVIEFPEKEGILSELNRFSLKISDDPIEVNSGWGLPNFMSSYFVSNQIFIPELNEKIGNEVIIPLKMSMNCSCKDSFGIFNFSVEIQFDASYFYPYPNSLITNNEVVNGQRILTLVGSFKPESQESILAEIEGLVLLGSGTKTLIKINKFEILNTEMEVETQDGSLEIFGVCAPDISHIILIDPLEVRASPNPVTDNLNFFLRYNYPTEISIHIFNTLSQELMVKYIGSDKVQNDVDIDVSHLPNGIYFATIKSGTEIITKQFVIMR